MYLIIVDQIAWPYFYIIRAIMDLTISKRVLLEKKVSINFTKLFL